MFCIKCGEEIPESSYFCLKCGVMTSEGIKIDVPSPYNWEKEVEKTLQKIAKDIGNAVDNVRESIRQSTKQEPLSCMHCGEKNPHRSKFCHNCGKELN
jgi:ribosomal protein L40E